MVYLSGYYWQQGDQTVSLVMKHLVYRKGTLPVFFGCLCVDETGRERGEVIVKRLTDWFYEEGMALFIRYGEITEAVEACFMRLIMEVSETCSAIVLLCVGNSFLLWNRGKLRTYFLNSRLGKNKVSCVAKDAEEELITGILQENVGILSVSDGIYERMSVEEIGQCLAVQALKDEAGMQRRLKELGEGACRKGGRHVGAMMLVTCQREE